MSVLDKRLILVAGKGGVGRSTVAASIAAATARNGRKTLLFEANANDRYGTFFDKAPVGSEITNLAPNLWAVNTNPAAALEEYGLMVLRFRRVYKLVFENRVTKYFLRAIPGLDDYALLGKAWFHTEEEKKGAPIWDTVVFDLPASGHSMSMLRTPKVILETVPEGPLTRDAKSLNTLLQDRERTALVLVTLAEEMPANEARELSTQMSTELGIEVAQLIINQVYPDRFPDGSPEDAVLEKLMAADQASLAKDLQAVVEHSHLARQRRRLNQRYLEELASAFDQPLTHLPLLFAPTLGPAEIDRLSQLIEAGDASQ